MLCLQIKNHDLSHAENRCRVHRNTFTVDWDETCRIFKHVEPIRLCYGSQKIYKTYLLFLAVKKKKLATK